MILALYKGTAFLQFFLMDENPLPMLDAACKMDVDPTSNALVFQSASICDPLLFLHLSPDQPESNPPVSRPTHPFFFP